jgi:hypothetical protein
MVMAAGIVSIAVYLNGIQRVAATRIWLKLAEETIKAVTYQSAGMAA